MPNEQAGTKMAKQPEQLTWPELEKYLPQQAVVVIQVNDDGTFKVIPENFFISKGLHGEVIWKLEPNSSDPAISHYSFKVVFAEKRSPFKDADFSDAHPRSGPIKGDVPDNTYWYYTVEVTHKPRNTNHKVVPKDPGGIVTQ